MIITLEGIDAAGKRTQAELLKSKAHHLGLKAATLSFPRYGKTMFAEAVASYLNGKFGELESIDPHFPALLYAGDRLESRDVITELSQSHDLLIIDRYVASNLAYQSARVDPALRPEFICWLTKIEHEIYHLPRPDLNIYLDMSVHVARKMMTNRKQRSYTADTTDLHERNSAYLSACREVYLFLISSNVGGKWLSVQCTKPNGDILEKTEINDLIWSNLRCQFFPIHG